MFRRLIVVLITCFYGIPVFADEAREPDVYIVQNVLTPENHICLANEIADGVYFFSKPCGETLSKEPSSTVNLVNADGSVYKTLHGISPDKLLVDAGNFYVFDDREKKYRPDIEKILKPFGKVLTVWYPDLSRKEMVSSEVKFENTGSGKLNVTQPFALNASGVIAYKGGSPFCMVDGKKGECQALEDPFLGWGNRYSCNSRSKASADLSFYCNSETYYCRKNCEDEQECQLTYSSYSSPDRIQCASGLNCRHDRYENMFFCNKDGRSSSETAILAGIYGFIATAIAALTTVLICRCVRKSKSKAFHSKYLDF